MSHRAINAITGAALAVALFMLGASYAFAEEVVASTRVSLAPIFDYVFLVLGAVIPPTLLIIIRHYLSKWTGIKLDAAASSALQFALGKGTSLAINAARKASKDIESFDVHNELVATAANYALARTPDAIARFGITPSELKVMAVARLEERLLPAP